MLWEINNIIFRDPLDNFNSKFGIVSCYVEHKVYKWVSSSDVLQLPLVRDLDSCIKISCKY